ncbi:uncharacterized protein A1O9_06362 [Exophiala aquamarina CBS 119918]|uniref:Uncharacterized protein n=1 Tax=Exophiala aquamarina CBS 119918 TaxID=1182545 RepID=A0A072PEY2_9EURO|nr:uncharacterized protein A1O9_06362 [Exophiala aquamarina CBS 119918]KEF58436.1 hypothetical protein A1O9_06362 [Exophiala aquamarina CBS 119918]
MAMPVPQKKKTSLFGGLFQMKEPTQVALNQVAAQMIAQHGSISPAKVPNVRLEKMPEHVPKVNSKWDGVPDSVKQREKHEREAAKTPKKELFSVNASRSLSSGTGEDSRRRLNSRNSSSTTGSFSSHGRSVASNGTSARGRFYAQSVNSSGDLASQQRPDSQRPPVTHGHARATSTSSLPDNVTEAIPEFPRYLRGAIAGPGHMAGPRNQNVPDENPPPPVINIRSASDQTPARKVEQAPSIEDVPTHSASPLPSPRDVVPATPSPLRPSDEYVFQTRSPTTEIPSSLSTGPGPDIITTTTIPKKKPPPIMTPGFLAGEAQELVLPNDTEGQSSADLPLRSWESGRMTAGTSSSTHSRVQQDLERRPDSSRARLGLRASILLRDDENPWERMEQDAPALPSPKSPRTPTSPRLVSSPRTKFSTGFGLFNKDKDRP